MVYFRVVAQLVDILTKAVVLMRVVLEAGTVLMENSAAGLGLMVVHYVSYADGMADFRIVTTGAPGADSLIKATVDRGAVNIG